MIHKTKLLSLALLLLILLSTSTALAWSSFQYSDRTYGNKCLYSIDGMDLSTGWKKLPLNQIIEDNGNISDDTFHAESISEIQNEKNINNTKHSPGFNYFDLFVAMIAIFLLNWRRRPI